MGQHFNHDRVPVMKPDPEGVDSWYKNSAGKVVNNSPFCFQEFWARTHDLEPENYVTG